MNKFKTWLNDFLRKESKINKEAPRFWLIMLGLLLLFIVLTIFIGISWMGWIVFIALLCLLFFYRFKILLLVFNIQIIILIITIILVFIIGFNYDQPAGKENNGPLPVLTYKSNPVKVDGGTYSVDLTTNNKDYRYEMELVYQADVSVLPKGFIWDATNAGSYKEQGVTVHNNGMLEAFITSDQPKVTYYSHGPVSVKTEYNTKTYKYTLAGLFPTTWTIWFDSKAEFKTWLNKYTNIELYQARVKEIGINDVEIKGENMWSYGYNTQKMYKLHPIVKKIKLDWTDLKQKTGLN